MTIALVLSLVLHQVPADAAAPTLSAPAAAVRTSDASTAAVAEALSEEQAVALALERNRDLIAARLDVRAAEVDKLAATVLPNPELSYSAGNIVLPPGNPQDIGLAPRPFSQLIHTVGISQVLDLWWKHALHAEAAEHGVVQSRLQLEDAAREISYAVRSAFEDLLREQKQHALAAEMNNRYQDTVRLSRARFKVGEISETELKKIELEGLKYASDELTAAREVESARQKLAELLALPSADALPEKLIDDLAYRGEVDAAAVLQRALEQRPDLRASREAVTRAQLALKAAHRDALPDLSVGLAYSRDNFTISGDNPSSLAATVSIPLPLFDRNQGGVGHAAVDLKRAENDAQKLELSVRYQVSEALRRAHTAQKLVDLYEGGMLDRADTALRVAEKSYKAGAISLLELLEAQRTYLGTRADYLVALNDYRQALVDLRHATGAPLS